MSFNHLIILPCHSIWKFADPTSESGQSPGEWHLAPFQIEGHDHLCFIEHIEKSFQLLKENPNALLVISGGQTKAEAGPISEALSYYELLKKLHPKADKDLFQRVLLEEYARDSFENVLFLLCRFHQFLNTYPYQITVVGFEFKRERFLNCHFAHALRFPESRVEYIGNSPTPGPEIDNKAYFSDLNDAEYRFALKHFKVDPYGVHDPLCTKKLSRDPFNRHHGYVSNEPSLATILSFIREEADVGPFDFESISSNLQKIWEC